MSRVGQMPIPCPSGVEVKIQGRRVEVQGPKGTLAREVHPAIALVQEDGILRVERSDDSRQARSLHGLTRSLVANMVEGVTEGHASAVLAASIFHFGTYSISEAKAYMAAAGVPVRLDEHG